MNRSETLWIAAFVTFVGGDMLTTLLGLELGLVERAPLYEGMHASLPAVMAAMKLIVTAVALTGYELIPEPANLGIPLGLAILGTAVTAWNSYLILVVV